MRKSLAVALVVSLMMGRSVYAAPRDRDDPWKVLRPLLKKIVKVVKTLGDGLIGPTP
jgi:hypothetical protein